MIDKNGRDIPSHLNVTSDVRDENRNFRVVQPEIDYAELRERFVRFFPQETKFVSASEFENRAKAGLEKLAQDEQVANLTKRAHLPLPFPQHDARGNYGQSLQEFFLPAVEQAYQSRFPDRQFINRRDNELAGKVHVMPNFGHDKFLDEMAEKPGVALYFPYPLQGFSIQAQREAMKILLKHNLLLIGAIESALGIVGFTKEMVGSFNTPGYDCSAVSWRSAGFSFYFKAFVGKLSFDHAVLLAKASDYYSGGLLFLS